MRFILGSLLLVLLASSLSPVHGVLESNYTNFKCKCIKTTSYVPRRWLVSSIDSTGPGNGCPRQEIIVTLKNNSVICLNPSSKGTKRLLKMLSKEKKLRRS